MDLRLFEEYINNSKIEDAIKMINDISESEFIEAAPLLIKHLQETENGTLRNKIAIALSDIGCNNAVEPIIRMIQDPKTIGNRGTLLYALESLDYLPHIEEIVDLLFEDSFEVSRQAFVLIGNIVNEMPIEKRQEIAKKVDIVRNRLQEKIDFLATSKEMLSAN